MKSFVPNTVSIPIPLPNSIPIPIPTLDKEFNPEVEVNFIKPIYNSNIQTSRIIIPVKEAKNKDLYKFQVKIEKEGPVDFIKRSGFEYTKIEKFPLYYIGKIPSENIFDNKKHSVFQIINTDPNVAGFSLEFSFSNLIDGDGIVLFVCENFPDVNSIDNIEFDKNKLKRGTVTMAQSSEGKILPVKIKRIN